MKAQSKLAFVILLLTCASIAQANPISLAPYGVNSYRVVFITSGTIGTTSEEIADYNAFVNDAARGSAIENELLERGVTNVSWHAWGSTATVDAIDNIQSSGAEDLPIVNARGELIALGWDQLLSATEMPPLSNNIGYDQNGELTRSGAVTGTNVFGTKFDTNVCLGCMRVVGGSAYIHSGVDKDPDGWTSGWMATSRPDASFRLYAFSSPITVRVPEPGTLALFSLGLLGLRFARSQRGTAV